MMDLLKDLAQNLCDRGLNLRQYQTPLDAVSCPAPRLVAHRGACDGKADIENTLSAFRRARALGAWGIEFDLHFTKDDEPVVCHDPDLLRVFSSRMRIAESNWSDLQKTASNLPHLHEVLSLDRLHFMIEVKSRLKDHHLGALHDALRGFRPKEDYHLLTLDPELVRLSPKTPADAWILVGEFNLGILIEISLQRGLGGVAGHYLLMTESRVKRLHRAGQRAGVGFVPNRNLFNREWNKRVDWVFTNHLGRIAEIV